MLEQNAENPSPGTPLASPDSVTQRRTVEQACVSLAGEVGDFLQGMLRDRHLAEDAWQKTVVRAIESAQSVRLGTIRGWLFRIALNEARAILRERSRLPNSTELSEDVARAQRSGMDCRELPMDQQLIREELRVALRASLELLPVDQREVIRRRVYLEMSFAEIAADMNVPLGTVLTWMRRGVVKLREDRALQKLLQD